MNNITKEFREFALRGSVLDLAIGVIIGAAFGRITASLVNDIILPPLGLAFGKVDFTNLYVNLSARHFSSLAQAQAAGAPTINYGLFINTIVNFVIVAAAIFFLIRWINRLGLYRKEEKIKPCPYCRRDIPREATRCPECTSQLT